MLQVFIIIIEEPYFHIIWEKCLQGWNFVQLHLKTKRSKSPFSSYCPHFHLLQSHSFLSRCSVILGYGVALLKRLPSHLTTHTSHWIPGDVLMNAAGMRNVFAAFKSCVVPSQWAWGSSGCWPLWVGSRHLRSGIHRLHDSTHHQPGYSFIIISFFNWYYLGEQSLPSDCRFPEETWAQTEVHSLKQSHFQSKYIW